MTPCPHPILLGLALLILPDFGQARDYSGGERQAPGMDCMTPESGSIEFAGFTWEVKAGRSGPGPNNWAPGNVCVDPQGRLHLRITHDGGRWHAAEVFTREQFGYGTYEFKVVSRLDELDPNVVFGLFAYPEEATGPDGTREVDIEFTRWGARERGYLNYAVWPDTPGARPLTAAFDEPLAGTHTTHRFVRQPQGASFQSFHGHEPGPGASFGHNEVSLDGPSYGAPEPLRVHLDLWLFRGRPPQNGREVEVIVSDFTFTPADVTASP